MIDLKQASQQSSVKAYFKAEKEKVAQLQRQQVTPLESCNNIIE